METSLSDREKKQIPRALSSFLVRVIRPSASSAAHPSHLCLCFFFVFLLSSPGWDYLSPYVILEPESRHLSYLDGAFKYEDRYVLWEEEHRNLALAAKLQRMKQLGIPLELANTLATPTTITPDHVFPNSGIRRALKRLYASGGRPSDAWWKQFEARPSRRNANERLLKRKEAKTLTEARRNIPDYIRRFEQENNATEVNVGATTVLAQNLFLQARIEAEKKKPSLLTKQQQQSAKNLMAVFAQRNRLAMKKMFLGTRNMWYVDVFRLPHLRAAAVLYFCFLFLFSFSTFFSFSPTP